MGLVLLQELLAEVGVWFDAAVLRVVDALLAGLLDTSCAAGVLGEPERAVGEDAEDQGGESRESKSDTRRDADGATADVAAFCGGTAVNRGKQA